MGLFSFFSSNKSDIKDLDDAIPKKTHCYHIEGFLTCSYFTNAVTIGDKLTAQYPNIKVDVSAYIKEQWGERARELQKEFNTTQRTSPFVYEGCNIENQKLIGGYTDFAKMVRATYNMKNVPMD